MNNLEINILQKDGNARASNIDINNKIIETPTFMPVATRGAIKSTPHTFLNSTQVLLANTYHLHLRPGSEIINDLGGIHRFMNWDKIILTDSGGFQAWSLPTKIFDDGVIYKNVYDGSSFEMTPELSIRIQNNLGSDIAMIFDCLIDINDEKEKQIKAIKLTRDWGYKTINNHKNKDQALFGIIQGGLHKDLREISSKYMVEQEYDGYAIGEYVMGLGDTHGLIDLIDEGIDLFDCVWPARLARHGKLIVGNNYINIKNEKYKDDSNPISESCNCFTCKNYSKAFLRHLIQTENTSAWLYLTVHNLIQTEIMLDEARESILKSNFNKFKEKYQNG